MRIAWTLAVATILGQISWVLVPASARTAVTFATVLTFAAASAIHAWATRGVAWALGYLAASIGIGWGVEAVGTATGLPFGEYTYATALGPQLLGVPLVIPLAWSMMAYPCLLAAQRLASTWWATALIGGFLFASWDLFLDPQMVGEGYWTWHSTAPALPGIDGIPLQNFLGWLLVAVVLMGLLDRLPRIRENDAVPTVLLTWVYLSNVLSAAAFFGRPAAAIWGGVCMGLVVIPWWLSLRRRPA